MKNVFTLIALFASANSFAGLPDMRVPRHPDQTTTLVSCREARVIADDGTLVEITAGGITGLTFANISQQSKMGPRPVGSLAVHAGRRESINDPIVYVSNAGTDSRDYFELRIDPRLDNEAGNYAAKLSARINEREYSDVRMTCQLEQIADGEPTMPHFPDQMYTLATCTEPFLADAGVTVRVISGGIIGRLRAEVSEQSRRGEIELGTVFLENALRPNVRAYVGESFDLSIDMDTGPTAQGYTAHLSAKFGERSYERNLLCTLSNE